MARGIVAVVGGLVIQNRESMIFWRVKVTATRTVRMLDR